MDVLALFITLLPVAYLFFWVLGNLATPSEDSMITMSIRVSKLNGELKVLSANPKSFWVSVRNGKGKRCLQGPFATLTQAKLYSEGIE